MGEVGGGAGGVKGIDIGIDVEIACVGGFSGFLGFVLVFFLWSAWVGVGKSQFGI